MATQYATEEPFERGIQNAQKITHPTVVGDFEQKSIRGQVEEKRRRRRAAQNDPSYNPQVRNTRRERLGETSQSKTSSIRSNQIHPAERVANDAEWEARGVGGENEKRMTGPVFWLMVMFAIVKDILDLVFTLTIVFSPLSILFAILFNLALALYMVIKRIPPSSKKLVAISLSLIIEMLPFLSAILPITTLNLFLLRHFDKKDISKED